jgi:hypothetical protein
MNLQEELLRGEDSLRGFIKHLKQKKGLKFRKSLKHLQKLHIKIILDFMKN